MGPELLMMNVVDCRATLRVHDSFQVLEILIGSEDHVYKDMQTPLKTKIILHSTGKEFPKEVLACFNAKVADMRDNQDVPLG